MLRLPCQPNSSAPSGTLIDCDNDPMTEVLNWSAPVDMERSRRRRLILRLAAIAVAGYIAAAALVRLNDVIAAKAQMAHLIHEGGLLHEVSCSSCASDRIRLAVAVVARLENRSRLGPHCRLFCNLRPGRLPSPITKLTLAP